MVTIAEDRLLVNRLDIQGFCNKYDMEEQRGAAKVGDEVGLSDFFGGNRAEKGASRATSRLEGAIKRSSGKREARESSAESPKRSAEKAGRRVGRNACLGGQAPSRAAIPVGDTGGSSGGGHGP
jgi:hypothetical protein